MLPNFSKLRKKVPVVSVETPFWSTMIASIWQLATVAIVVSVPVVVPVVVIVVVSVVVIEVG